VVTVHTPGGPSAGPYQGYLYAYPHKTAYRPLRPRPALPDVWADEPRDALFLYLHLPFCEMRCGFCNLFTRANPPAEQVGRYLAQLRSQAGVVSQAVGGARFVAGAVGGGTPTYLDADELTELFDIVDAMTGTPGAVPLSVETSPATATPDRLAVVAARGAWRVSLGVQSFLDAEAHAAGRPQRRSDVDLALAAIRASGVPELNIDLMYGIGGQTARTWAASLRAALAWRPEEVYLYPLYVRPLTGLGRRPASSPGPARDLDWDEQRMRLYRQGRDTLRAAGYTQLSMRHFRLGGVSTPPGEYCCQDDGMVGLGCGARSYTRDLHYSFDYAVSVGGVRAVIEDYLARPAGDFSYAEAGFALDEGERRRRWLVKTLLRSDGVDRAVWRARFGGDVTDHVPELARLADRGWLTADDATLRLTDEGLAHSDAVGPWLVSDAVRLAMGEYELR
jgi:coproporphyrinogen III oxidase-like Fe-S oxidoreductase